MPLSQTDSTMKASRHQRPALGLAARHEGTHGDGMAGTVGCQVSVGPDRYGDTMNDPLTDDIIEAVPAAWRDQLGTAVYTGGDAWTDQSDVYLLGINPGGPASTDTLTVSEQVSATLARPRWSKYVDEDWGLGEGKASFQRRVRHLLGNLDLDPADVPAGNVAFARSRRAVDLPMDQIYRECWPFHAAMIGRLGVKVVFCMGGNAANFVREQVGARAEVDRHVATAGLENNRLSATYTGPGPTVVRLSHPSKMAWNNPSMDPSALAARALAAIQ